MRFTRLHDINLKTTIDINLDYITEVVPVDSPDLESAAVRIVTTAGERSIWVGEHDPSRPLSHNLDLFWDMVHAQESRLPRSFLGN